MLLRGEKDTDAGEIFQEYFVTPTKGKIRRKIPAPNVPKDPKRG